MSDYVDAHTQNLDRVLKKYWLQNYIKKNHEELGFSSVEGPFHRGPDFAGIYDGNEVTIAVEAELRDCIHDNDEPAKVDILIVLSADDPEEISGISPDQWRASLPNQIIRVLATDLIRATHEERITYVIQKLAGVEHKHILSLIGRISSILAILWRVVAGEKYYEGSPDAKYLPYAIAWTAIEYIDAYDIDTEALKVDFRREVGVVLTRIEIIANQVLSGKTLEELSDEDADFVSHWLEILRQVYNDQF